MRGRGGPSWNSTIASARQRVLVLRSSQRTVQPKAASGAEFVARRGLLLKPRRRAKSEPLAALIGHGLCSCPRAGMQQYPQSRQPGETAPKKHVISIEAQIGAGKTTVLNKLREEFPDLAQVPEPVDRWEETGLLLAMYNGLVNRAVFQQMALVTRASDLTAALREHDWVITERSPISDRFVFAAANMEEGSWEYESYMETYRSVTKMMPDYVWHQIQLTVDQQELDFRVAVRARKSETATDALPTWYNEKIRRLHDDSTARRLLATRRDRRKWVQRSRC